MKYLEDSRLTQLTSDLTGAFLNTRSGSGSGGESSSSVGLVGISGNDGSSSGTNNQGKDKNDTKPQQSGEAADGSTKNNHSTSPSTATTVTTTPPAYYTYNPVGYSTYNNNNSSSSCRVIYGRVEAYTTKRAGSDKKTAFEVGERYAHEMERLNEAVEALKRKHHMEQEQHRKECEMEENFGEFFSGEKEDVGQATATSTGGRMNNAKIERRRRSRSVDGVTFATVSPKIVYDKNSNTAAMMNTSLMPLEEAVTAIAEEEAMQDGMETITSHAAKRNLPLEGILKQPSSSSSSNKRCRATSFDISTGPSHSYHHSESSSSLLAGTAWTSNPNGNTLPLSIVHPPTPTIDEDRATHPLIPQQSIYQSSNGDKPTTDIAGTPTMVPRRLVTDLILTLNASFPDYDFGEAQVSDFCTLSTSEAMRRIDEQLGEFARTTDTGRDFLPRFWNSLEDVLGGLKDCEVYSYAPKGRSGEEDDPLEFLTRSMAAAKESVVFSQPADGGRIVSGDTSLGDGLDTSMAYNLSNQMAPSSTDPPHVTLWSMNYFFVSRNKKRIVLFACVQAMRTPQGNDGEYDDDFGRDEYEYGENNLVFDEARRGMEDEYNDTYTSLTSMNNNRIGSSSSITKTAGDESVSVMVEDTDLDEEVDVIDVDGDDEVHGENEFDTGTLSVPSRVA
mmetsp:Transcript_6304/g.10950  ORF Transcript_6304/g.10950 Transcript_6304/m.10950 type:complete len:672 (-) Transcript_6304:239-2254(-)